MLEKKKIGIMQGRLSKPKGKLIQSFPTKTWKKEFIAAKKLSINLIEWTLDFKNLHQNPLLTERGIKDINLLSKQHNVKIKTITGDCFMQKPFWKQKNKKIMLSLISDLKKILTNASRLKVKYLTIPLVDGGSIKNKSQENFLIKELLKLKNFLKTKKINILFETDLPPKESYLFIKKFNCKSFGINYDIGNSASMNFNPVNEFKYYGKYIKNVHIKDRKKYGNTVKLGNGNANFSLIFKLLKKIRYNGYLILQTARSESGNELKNISNNIKFLDQYI